MKKYSTSDLYLSSFLFCKGMELDNLQKVGNKYYLLFKGYEICNGLANDYLANRASVRAKDYVNAIKTVRGLIFEEIEKEKLN